MSVEFIPPCPMCARMKHRCVVMTPEENQKFLRRLAEIEDAEEFQQYMTSVFGPASHVNIHISEVQ